MDRTYLAGPSMSSFDMTKNSTFGGGDSGFSGSRDDSALRTNDTRLSALSNISGSGVGIRLGELI